MQNRTLATKSVQHRNTEQRIEIINYLKSVHNHPTAEGIYLKVKKKIPHITLGTVYRNLSILVNSGKVKKIDLDGEARYDATTDKHQHCICKKCGKITDVENIKISNYAINNLENPRFTASDVEILYFGECSNCK